MAAADGKSALDWAPTPHEKGVLAGEQAYLFSAICGSEAWVRRDRRAKERAAWAPRKARADLPTVWIRGDSARPAREGSHSPPGTASKEEAGPRTRGDILHVEAEHEADRADSKAVAP